MIRDVGGECFCTQVRKLGRSITRIYNHYFRSAGMGITQFSLLCTLYRKGPTPLAALAEELAMERTTLLRNSQLLSRRGWIIVEKKKDGKTRLELTARGDQALRKCRPLWVRAQAMIKKLLGPIRFQQIQKALHNANGLAGTQATTLKP